MVVQVAGCVAVLGWWAYPYSVDAVLRASVERTVSVALVEDDEESCTLSSESPAVQDVRHQSFEIVVAHRNGRWADACEPVHIVAVVGR